MKRVSYLLTKKPRTQSSTLKNKQTPKKGQKNKEQLPMVIESLRQMGKRRGQAGGWQHGL